ncbi:MAG: ATP-binding cassette domain-containing protein [Armatimonadota bacterium]|nr:ATP-binding cassette domain-containing protein [Armatimonadota bacterium]
MSLVEIQDLSFTYPDGTEALHAVSLTLQEGASLGLIGPNGAGKSTLLLHLNGILHGSGSVSVRGRPVEQWPSAELRATVGVVFEDPTDQLFMPTVLDDVCFGPLNMGLAPEEARERAEDVLRSVGAQELADRAPHHLSAGQRRRVALAAVLAMEPELLVIDEPVMALDPEGREEVIALLAGLPQAKLIASHDLAMVLELCEEVAILDEGRIHAAGPAREVLGDEALLRAHGLRVPPSLNPRVL